MHSERNKDNFLVACEKCDVKFKSKRELNIHMKTHTYKDNYTGKVLNGFKCETCDFTEQDGWSMQILHGKCHSKLFECGLCDFEAKTLENLELPPENMWDLWMWRMWICIKKHFSENKKCDASRICHIKMDGNNAELANCKEYNQSDLYWRKLHI